MTPQIVRFVVENNNGVLRTLPAMVVNQFGGQDGPPALNLQVFLDGPNSLNDGFSADDCAQGLAWKGTVVYGSHEGGWVFGDEASSGTDPHYTATQLEQLIRGAVAAYEQVMPAAHNLGIDAAVEATIAIGQQIDLADGTDDWAETPEAFRPHVESIIAAYLSMKDSASLDAIVQAILAGMLSGNDGSGPGEPAQGQVNPDGSYITAQQWFLDRGFSTPSGPAGSVGADFIWGPNAPDPSSPDWATAPWVWRPPLA